MGRTTGHLNEQVSHLGKLLRQKPVEFFHFGRFLLDDKAADLSHGQGDDANADDSEEDGK